MVVALPQLSDREIDYPNGDGAEALARQQAEQQAEQARLQTEQAEQQAEQAEQQAEQ